MIKLIHHAISHSKTKACDYREEMNFRAMFSSKKHFKGLLTASVVCTLIMLLSIWSPSISPFQSSICPSSSYKAIKTTSGDKLEMALSGASMANKTLIIAILNKAYIEGEKPMLDIFLESFWLGEKTQFLVDHLLVVAMDQTAFDRCKFLRLHCYRLVTEGVDFGGEKLYMSHDFINMMWRRTIFLAEVLQRGYSFIFTDIDVMWLRNPFLHLQQNETDMQISCDKFGTSRWCRYNLINTGFYFVKSNNKTIALYNKWYASRNETKYKGMKEQDVLKSMIQGGQFRDMGLTVSYLDTVYFSGFCENNKRFGLVATVHANCCRTINAKVADLTAVLRDWKDLKTMVASRKRARWANNETRVIGWSLHTACSNSWNGFRGQIL